MKLSLVITTYNRAHLIMRSINSAINQGFYDVEIIIVDDASSDETVNVVSEIGDSRLRLVVHDRNKGNAAARNSGIIESTGDVICFLDSDDELLPGYFDEVVSVFSNSEEEVGFLWCGAKKINDTLGLDYFDDDIWIPEWKNVNNFDNFITKGVKVGLNYGVAVRRSCFDVVGLFDENLRAAVDTDFFYRIAGHYKYKVIDKVMVHSYDHDGYMVRKQMDIKADAYDLIIEKNKDVFRRLPEAGRRLHTKAMWLHYRSGNRSDARAHLRHALRYSDSYYDVLSKALVYEIFGSVARPLHAGMRRLRKSIAKVQ